MPEEPQCPCQSHPRLTMLFSLPAENYVLPNSLWELLSLSWNTRDSELIKRKDSRPCQTSPIPWRSRSGTHHRTQNRGRKIESSHVLGLLERPSNREQRPANSWSSLLKVPLPCQRVTLQCRLWTHEPLGRLSYDTGMSTQMLDRNQLQAENVASWFKRLPSIMLEGLLRSW